MTMSTKAQPEAKIDEAHHARRVRRAKTCVAKQAKEIPAPVAPKPTPQVATPKKITNKTPSPPAIKEIGGSGVYIWDMMMIDRVAATSPTFIVEGEDCTKKMAAIALRAFKPTDTVEGMLAAQAVALHHASLECSRRAILQGQPAEITSKLRRDAANMSRAMVDMCEALDRRRGKGPQTIRVERVVVQDGGQAVVAGSVVTGNSPSALAAIGQGEPPMDVDALKAVAMDEVNR